MTHTNIINPPIRPGSIIEIISLHEDSAFYEDFISGNFQVIYRILSTTEIYIHGLMNIEQIPTNIVTNVFEPKYKIIAY